MAELPPILAGKHFFAPSVFEPENLLREARRQKKLPSIEVPEICVLDPDGDIVRALGNAGRTGRSPSWACYHTELYEFEHAPPPYFILIDRALRDEGTSYHYLPPAEFAAAKEELVKAAMEECSALAQPLHRGASWTTDAPFRETAAAIEGCRARNILAVEMEAAGLYAFAQARDKPILCFAHVTNQMGQTGDFEKGEANGAIASLSVIDAVAAAWLGAQPP